MGSAQDLLKLDGMFPEDLNQYLSRGGDAAVVPVGSVEQHGPHLLLGCDGFVAQMVARYTAMHSGAILFPMAPLSWIGGLRTWPGTLDMRPWVTGEYLEEAVGSIIRGGFKRVMIVNCHGGGREMVFSVADRLFRKTGCHVLSMYPTNVYDAYPELWDLWRRYGIDMDWAAVEASELMGALKFLCRDDLLEKVIRSNEAAIREFGEITVEIGPASLKNAFLLGEMGHDYDKEALHVQPRTAATAGGGMAAAEFMGMRLADAIQALGRFLGAGKAK